MIQGSRACDEQRTDGRTALFISRVRSQSNVKIIERAAYRVETSFTFYRILQLEKNPNIIDNFSEDDIAFY